MTKIEKEKQTVELMIGIYCRGQHKSKTLCPECSQLRDYAHQQLDRCTFGEKKEKCMYCPIHCYEPEMREKIRKVMRYSGPRMMLYHPIITIKTMLGIH